MLYEPCLTMYDLHPTCRTCSVQSVADLEQLVPNRILCFRSTTAMPKLPLNQLIRAHATRRYATAGGLDRSHASSRWSASTVLLGVIPIFTFGLGVWQIKRLQWKVALIDDLEEKLSRDEMALPRRIKCAASAAVVSAYMSPAPM